MKKILSVIISLSMLLSLMEVIPAYAEGEAETTNVVWIGGSYAAGAGANEKPEGLPAGVSAMAFAKRVTNWIDENTEGTVNYYNVCKGGTNSDYGRNRFEKDVLSHDPDIIFIEFTGNDSTVLGQTQERTSLALEGMVRATQLYEKENDKDVKIVFLYRPWFTGNDTTGASYDLNREAIGAYHAVADYYGIYELDAAEEAKRLWEADGADYAEMISNDKAHPTALGHYYTGKAIINILEKNPITNHIYRSLPMNANYTEISPVYIDASNASYIDSENTTGFTAEGTTMVSSTAGDTLQYNFNGTSIGVESSNVTAKVNIYVDDKMLTNFSAGKAEALANTQTLSDGPHTLKIVNAGGGAVTINDIIVDGIANEGMTAKETYTRSVYEDPCTSKDELEGRSLLGGAAGCSILNMKAQTGSQYPEAAISFGGHMVDQKVITYQLNGTTGFGANSNVSSVNIKYYEQNKDSTSFEGTKNIEVRAIDASGNELKAFTEDDVSYELNNAKTNWWKLFNLKVYNVPAGTTGIALYLHNTNNTALNNVKIEYADAAIDGISLDIDKKWISVGDAVPSTILHYTNYGDEQVLDAGASVTYTSSDASIASVDASGVITGVAEGAADITATAEIDAETYTCTMPVLVRDVPNYTDTEPKDIPASLITNADVIRTTRANNGVNGIGAGGRLLTANARTTQGEWTVFCPVGIYARTSWPGAANTAAINADSYKAGTTYVYTAKVKNSSDDTTMTPYYGIAINTSNNYNNGIGSNEYGRDGMAVTSTDWMDFKATISFPDDWDPTKSTQNYEQIIYMGLGKLSPEGSKVTVNNSLTDSLYLAEEAPREISLTAGNGAAELAQGGTLEVTAEVLDQVGLKGGLDQTVSCVVLSQDREEEIEGITASVSGNTVTLSCDDSVPAGTYTVVAISDAYDMVKGMDFDVISDPSAKYADYVTPAKPVNLITNSNVLNNNSGNATIATETGVGYKYTATEKTQNNPWNVFCPSALYARNSKATNNGLDLDYYKAGATYVYTAKVKNASDDTTLTPYYGIAIPAKNDGSYNNAIGSNEYGKDGMAVTSTDWTDFKATITFPTTWNEASTSADFGQKIYAGIGKKSDLASAVIIDTTVGDSLYLAEEILYDISNEVVTGSTTLNNNSTVTLKSELTNQIGLTGGLDQNVTWYALSSDRTEVVDSITITEDPQTGYATVSVSEDTPAGEYAIVAYSQTYRAAKGINITVSDGPKAELTLSQDAGYVWLEASAENLECENISFFVAAYDQNGNMLYVTFEDCAVTDGTAALASGELWLGGDDPAELASGTVVKAFAWEKDNLRPIELTAGSVSQLTID